MNTTTTTVAVALVQTAKSIAKCRKAAADLNRLAGEFSDVGHHLKKDIATIDALLQDRYPRIDAELRQILMASAAAPTEEFPDYRFKFSQDIFDFEIIKAKGNNIEIHFRWTDTKKLKHVRFAGKANYLPSLTGGYVLIHIRDEETGAEYTSRPLFNSKKDERIEYLEHVFKRAFTEEAYAMWRTEIDAAEAEWREAAS